MSTALVLPSPFLPALVHAPLAAALGRRGWGVVVSEPPPSPVDAGVVLRAFSDDAVEVVPDVVVAHSNAGRFAGFVAPAGAVVAYVDAALPPESGEATLAPEALLDHLAGLAGDDGLLPPWTRWWADEDVASVLPDAAVLARVRAAEGRVPLSYVRSRLGAPSGWRERRSAYLAFGETYAEEVGVARSVGWPVEVLEGAGHLHQLVDPEAVADAVVGLVARVRSGGQ
ncbi:hypothetical protein [Oryzobacter telluris]|uniref:hypothetical protein n=1 Tax=Oryzobacter telluris TaxID=3149179 RepID=UPI00370DCA44